MTRSAVRGGSAAVRRRQAGGSSAALGVSARQLPGQWAIRRAIRRLADTLSAVRRAIRRPVGALVAARDRSPRDARAVASATFDPSGPCTVDGRVAGAYPDLEAMVPRTLLRTRRRRPLDSGRNCSSRIWARSSGHGIDEVRFAGGYWPDGDRQRADAGCLHGAEASPPSGSASGTRPAPTGERRPVDTPHRATRSRPSKIEVLNGDPTSGHRLAADGWIESPWSPTSSARSRRRRPTTSARQRQRLVAADVPRPDPGRVRRVSRRVTPPVLAEPCRLWPELAFATDECAMLPWPARLLLLRIASGHASCPSSSCSTSCSSSGDCSRVGVADADCPLRSRPRRRADRAPTGCAASADATQPRLPRRRRPDPAEPIVIEGTATLRTACYVRAMTWQARKRAWEADRLHPPPERAPERKPRFSTISDVEIDRLYGPVVVAAAGDDGSAGAAAAAARRRVDHHGEPTPARADGRWDDFDPLRDVGLPGRAAVHARHPPDRLPRAGSGRCGCSPASAPPRTRTPRFHAAARRRPDRPLDRLRHADALRLRHRRPRGGGRVRDVRRRGQLAGRHGGPARRPAARPRLDLDDDQLAGRADLGDVHRRGREARASRGQRSRARPRTTSSRSSSPRRSSSSRPSRRCAS